jgi:hypothetical protein
MATPGQPTSCKPEYPELAHNYCLLGATNEVLGDFFGVVRRAIQNWIAVHTDFADAVRRGLAVSDATVVRALFERAKGFSHQVSRTTLYQGEARTITNTCAMPATELERSLLARQENERRNGRKGRKLPATIQCVGFVNDINHLDVHCGSRFAPLGVAETGGNCPQF